jgi:hypothetical protein
VLGVAVRVRENARLVSTKILKIFWRGAGGRVDDSTTFFHDTLAEQVRSLRFQTIPRSLR